MPHLNHPLTVRDPAFDRVIHLVGAAGTECGLPEGADWRYTVTVPVTCAACLESAGMRAIDRATDEAAEALLLRKLMAD